MRWMKCNEVILTACPPPLSLSRHLLLLKWRYIISLFLVEGSHVSKTSRWTSYRLLRAWNIRHQQEHGVVGKLYT